MTKAARRDFAPTRNTAEAFNLPAPIGGLNFATTLVNQDPTSAVTLQNMIPRTYGCELRKGHVQWSKGPVGGEVRTLLPYAPYRGEVSAGTPDHRLFAASSDGNIYDVTLPGVDPAVSVAIASQEVPGEFEWTTFATQATTYLCTVSHGGGYWVYDTAGGWVEITTGTGALQLEFPVGDTTTTKDFQFIYGYKGRLFFIKAETSEIYYIEEPGAIAGKLGYFDLGALLPHGGDVKMMAGWTIDSGTGIDDRLVFVASEGDILIFSGADPGDVNNWSLDGVWFCGRVPRGRRFMSQYGGDLLIVCARGLLRLSEIMRGEGFFLDRQQSARKVNQRIARSVVEQIDEKYWEVRLVESQQVLFINAPRIRSSVGTVQWMMEQNTMGWAQLWDIDMVTCEIFSGGLYFAKPDGYIYLMFEGSTDVVTPDPSGVPSATNEVVGELQTAFTPVGDPFRRKQFVLAKPCFISPVAPSIKVQCNVNWSLAANPGSPTFTEQDNAKWDEAIWDQATWSGEVNTYEGWVGLLGEGTHASLRLKIQGEYPTTFTNWVVVANPGGVYGS